MPTNDRVWWFIWHVPSGIFTASAHTNELFRAEFTNNRLYAWRKIAFCDKPQEFDLPLVDGKSNKSSIYPSTYFKTQENIVTVSANIKSETPLNNGDLLAILPVGFRPIHNIGIISRLDMSRSAGAVNIYTTGEIRVFRLSVDSDTEVSFDTTFIAAPS